MKVRKVDWNFCFFVFLKMNLIAEIPAYHETDYACKITQPLCCSFTLSSHFPWVMLFAHI